VFFKNPHPSPSTPEDRYKWVALTVASLGTLVGILNASTLIIALPTMMVGLDTTLVNVMWVLIAYMLVMTILAPACGRLADMYGRKKIYTSMVLSPSQLPLSFVELQQMFIS